jgi:hypothetical protein
VTTSAGRTLVYSFSQSAASSAYPLPFPNKLNIVAARKVRMSQPAGRYISVSRFRRLIVDLMHFSAKVPGVTLERRMDLARLVAARQACTPAPSWSAIFTKAFAVVAARNPVFRTAYLTFPWARFYEHGTSIATVNVDRQLDSERIILYAHIDGPESRTLREIDAIIQDHKQRPVESIPSYRSAVRMSRLPWPLRRLVLWAGLNVLGSLRCRFFGTFGITSVGSQGAGITHLLPLLTCQLHYGIFEPAGGLAMRVSFDHRVLDGATAAQGLADLEKVLLEEVLCECTAESSLPSSPSAVVEPHAE